MQTVPIADTLSRVSFFRDDTIDVVRQHVALAVGSHPDRLFIEVKVKLPKDYYFTNPKHWMELFYRLAHNRARIPAEVMRTYTNQIRSLPSVPIREYNELDWEEKIDDLKPILNPGRDFYEWRILGVDSETSVVMPLPPVALPDYRGIAPLPRLQSLFETQHPYEITEFRVTDIGEGVPEPVRKNYFPYFGPETPANIESMRASIRSSQEQLQRLFDLSPPKHQKVSILRAKWYVPLISTRFNAPRNRFEQIFYGLTVSELTPYIGYFTSKGEVVRHKFYVDDPKNKILPDEFKSSWKAWTNKTQPQRRRPTLLLYRGTSRTSFDRIAITDKDITFSAERDKKSDESLEDIRKSLEDWFQTLDAVVPFIVPSDVEESRWQLDMLSAISSYSRSVQEFDMHRFPCLQNVFSYYADSFRLLRTEHTSDDISPLEIQAYQVLNQGDVDPSATLLQEELGLSAEDAEALFSKITSLGETFDIEKAAKAYPVIKFSGTEVVIKFVANLERTLQYADILRYVLSSDAEEVNAVCPRRLESVAPVVAIPQQAMTAADVEPAGEDFFAGFDLDVGAAPEPVEPGGAAAAREEPRERRLAVRMGASSTFNYFNTRLQKFDSKTFDQTYPGECERTRQVVVLSARDQERIGDDYNYSNRSTGEKLPLDGNPENIAICPPYWCIRDEIPLQPPVEPWQAGHLRKDDEGEPRCPKCGGRIRSGHHDDPTVYTVIERRSTMMYPDFMKAVSATNKRKLPCCYQSPRPDAVVLSKREDVNYVLGLERSRLPGLRFAYLDPELAKRLRLKTNYKTTVRAGRLIADTEDIFRIGLGRPSKTLPKLLDNETEIKRPKEAKENVMKCSFFRTWRKLGRGDSETDKIIDSIDQAYESGDLDIIDELEYVTTFLTSEIIRIDPKTMEVVCGFWSESAAPRRKILVLIGDDLLGFVKRIREGRSNRLEFTADLQDEMFANTKPLLMSAHADACASGVPTLRETLDKDVIPKGKLNYQLIMDPYDRVQAVYIPNEVILPVYPTGTEPPGGIRKLKYHELRDSELPPPAVAKAYLEATSLSGHKIKAELRNALGEVTEYLLASGMRSPVYPGEEVDTTEPTKEVVETVRTNTEDTLVNGFRNQEDLAFARETTYASEIYDFLMFSLSKDILGEDYASLRRAIEEKSGRDIMTQLKTWFKDTAYVASPTDRPLDFINKIRKPCGQFKDKDTCNASGLCGWVRRTDTGKTCKIKVKGVADKDKVIERMALDLVRNDKLRGLVLDDRISPFFSTVLYYEMPHELITTEV